LLAGRKLLLADDSITIQKVVALTFADEGIEVLAVNNGRAAVEKLEEFRPDIVLADVYMPEMTGLQVCDYIKKNDSQKHIPVMLLVGSFEPFDEAEARRVGADDTLTKPFQSIRTLVEKVGVLLGREVPPPARPSILQNEPESLAFSEEAAVVGAQTLDGASTLDGAQTLELVEPHHHQVSAEPLKPAELELMTADTRPLSNEIQTHLQAQPAQDRAIENVLEVQKMETHLTSNAAPASSEGFGETILDLDDYEATPLVATDDVVLDIDFDAPAPAQSHRPSPYASESAIAGVPAVAAVAEGEYAAAASASEVTWEAAAQKRDDDWSSINVEKPPMRSGAVTGELSADVLAASQSPEAGSQTASLPAPAARIAAPASGPISLAQMSPEVIDAIARRVVEQLSEKVVQEIAWEVVPQLAELLIKQKLEQPK